MLNNELQESVLVVKREIIDALCPKLFNSQAEPVKAAVLANYRFLERTVAEHDFTHKQVIPYVVIRHGQRFLLTRRTDKQTERRLHNLYSLGIGGHINNGDMGAGQGDIILSGMRREMAEEIALDGEESCELIGIINDDSTEVARVHVGFVFLLSTAAPQFRIVEQDKYTAAWKLPAEMTECYAQMESWAQIVYEHVVSPAGPRR